MVELSRQVDGLFAAAFSVTHDLGPPAMAYIADAFDPAHGDMVKVASRAICEACRRAAVNRRLFVQKLGRPDFPTWVVVAVPVVEADVVRAAFGVILNCDDDADRRRRLGTAGGGGLSSGRAERSPPLSAGRRRRSLASSSGPPMTAGRHDASGPANAARRSHTAVSARHRCSPHHADARPRRRR